MTAGEGTYQVKQVMAGGFSTRYLEAGDPSKPKLVLIHDGAFGTTAELCWDGVIADFAKDYHVFAPELLGWGGTDKVVYFDRSPYAARIPHVTAFLREVGVTEADFLGSSFGGSLIVRASIEPGNPWGIRRGISIAGTGGPFRHPEGIEALGNYTPSLEAAAKLTGLIAGTVEGLEEHIRLRFENSMIPGHWESMMAPKVKNPSATRASSADDYFDRLAATSVKILLVEGTRDPLLETGWAEKMAALSPNIDALVVEASHEPNIENPALVVEFARNYFSQKAGA